MVTPFVWLFIESFEAVRHHIFNDAYIDSLIQLEYNAFEPACVPVCAFAFCKTNLSAYVGNFVRLSDFKGHEAQSPSALGKSFPLVIR
jgi:hypothetical protein